MMKIYRLSVMAALCVSLLSVLTGCQDDEFLPTPDWGGQQLSSTRSTALTSALVQGTDGHWRATQCVPLVGKGRIVDDFSDGLVKALGEGGGYFDPMLDTDLTNAASFASSLADVEVLGNQLVSVRDLDRTYAGGQVAGFVYKISDSSLLELDVLKGFWLSSYLNGVEQETHMAGTDTDVLGLSLLNIASNNADQGMTVSAFFEKPFDEIKIGISGISADLLKALKIYYAFVGENETKYCIQGSRYFPNSKVHGGVGWTSWASFDADDVVDNDLDNGVATFLINAGKITIDTGEEIPAGSEVGFVTTSGSLLDLGIGATTQLTTYDANDSEVEEISVAKVLGLSLIGGGKTAVSMITTKPCRQIRLNFTGLDINLGSTKIHYAYVKDPIAVDPTSYFSLSDVVITGNSYYLSAPKGGTTTWTVIKSPKGTMPSIKDNKVTGMTVDGNYVISGAFVNEENYSVTQQMVITRAAEQKDGCNQMIGTEYGATAEAPLGSSGALIELKGFSGAENLVDNDWNNYAKYTGGLDLANNTGIVAITTTQPVNPDNKRIKTGFVMQTANGFLGLDLLQFFVVKLYNDGTMVEEQAIDGNGVADVGLIGSKGNKIRVGFTTDKTFDRIELWTAGVLKLDLQEYRIYGAYWEDADAGCVSADPSEACIELLTPASHGAAINYSESKVAGVAAVGTSYNNLGNLLDTDMETGALISGAVNVATATTVAVKFDEINDPNQSTKIGFIVKSPTGVLDVGLLKGTVLKIYHQGVEVGESGEGGVLDLDLIGYTGRAFVETTAETTAFDEVRITFGQGLGVLNGNVELSGVFVRRDSDADGIPDCAEDEENKDVSDISGVSIVGSEHICLLGEPVFKLSVNGGVERKTYTLKFDDIAFNNDFETQCKLDGYFTLSTKNMKPGDYYMGIYDGNDLKWNGVHIVLHPAETTWKGGRSTDWNDWHNWTNGVPWECTSTVIPSNCRFYPVLEKDKEYFSYYIHFCPGAEVVNTHYLYYGQAWVEFTLTGGRYHMLSAPLHDMVTGDMFIPENLNGNHGTWKYFDRLTPETAPESRLNPTVYQRFWNSNATGHTIEGPVTVTPDATSWTPPINDLAQRYTAGMGFSLKAGTATRSYTFRFPKEHTQYNYVYSDGSHAGQPAETISRDWPNPGRFIHENENGLTNFPYQVTVTNQTAGTTFIAGNPFMAHIDIEAFLKENPKVTSVKVNDGSSNNSWMLADGKLVGTDGSLPYLAPMQGFFVTNPDPLTSLNLKYTEAMLVQCPDVRLDAPQQDEPLTRAISRSVAPSDREALRITAYSQGTHASCVVFIRPHAADGYLDGEDSRILLDNEVQPVVAVFTEADGQALDIQQLSSRMEIPLGFSLKNQGNVFLKLNHASGSNWDGWMLVDKQTGQRWSLEGGYTQVDLGTTTSHAGRFCLVRSANP